MLVRVMEENHLKSFSQALNICLSELLQKTKAMQCLQRDLLKANEEVGKWKERAEGKFKNSPYTGNNSFVEEVSSMKSKQD